MKSLNQKLWALTLIPLLTMSGGLLAVQGFAQSSPTQSQEVYKSSPFALDDLLALLAAGVTAGRLAGQVKERGITFDFTPDTEQKLRLAGADDSLLLEISKASARRPPPPKPEPAPPPPLQKPTLPAEHLGAFDIIPVADGVYAALGKNTAPMLIGSNAAFIVNEDDVVVVDTHYTPSAARALQAEIKKLTPKPVRYVVNTHWHNDHTQGNQAYFNVFPGGVEFISSHATREDIERKAIPSVKDSLQNMPGQIARAEEQLAAGVGPDGQALNDEQKQQRRAQLDRQKGYLAELEQLQITLPTITFERSLVLHKKSRSIHILFFGRGHTRGDVIVYLPGEKVLVSGDLVTAGLPFPRDSYPADWIKTLRALAGLDFAQVIPGHGPVEQGKEQVSLIADVFEAIVAQVRDAVAKGLSLDDTKKAVNVESFRERVTATTQPPLPPAAFKARVDGVVERAYLEAKGELNDRF